MMRWFILPVVLFATSAGFGQTKSTGPKQGQPTVAEAETFLKTVEAELLRLWIDYERLSWIKATYITYDTELMASKAHEALMAFISRKAAAATRYDKLDLPAKLKRKFKLLKVNLSLPAPNDPRKRSRLAAIVAFMKSAYGKGKYCPKHLEGKCLTLGDMSDVLAKSRDFNELKGVWVGWRTVSVPMRARFEEYVKLANEGARSLGFGDLGDLWKSRFDMSPQQFEAEVERLWQQVEPLYVDLHCHVRARLQDRYGKDKVPSKGPIPAHLLGNMWSQEWGYLFDLVAPDKPKDKKLAEVLKAMNVDEKELVRYGEAFFVSLGLEPLPKTFWERSMFVKPRDREVVCHASAWNIDWHDDLRIKMCIKINEEDFSTVHHELGHNYYQRAYNHQPPLFMDSANPGFHEALGDTISLSVTPSYMVKIGVLDNLPSPNLNPLMQRALERVAFLPFGVVMDRWRWDVFAGRIQPRDYNRAWWKLRTRYQGIAPPVARTEQDFDPGAKYHIASNVPYTRYFLATILQFQFHRGLCRIAGHKGPLHTCSIYGNKEAGKRLKKMMAMGLSRPWPEALKALTGEERMDATAILDYFKPLHAWLKQQNKNRRCGW